MQCCSPVFNTSAAGKQHRGVSAARFSVQQPASPRRRTDATSPSDSTHVDAGCEMTLAEESAVLPATRFRLCNSRLLSTILYPCWSLLCSNYRARATLVPWTTEKLVWAADYGCGSTALMMFACLFACDELTASLWRVDCVTSQPGDKLTCDELTVWRVDHVMSWPCDELTGSRSNCGLMTVGGESVMTVVAGNSAN